MADTAISALSVSTSPTTTAVGVIADGGVDYKISLANMVKAGSGVLLSPGSQQAGTINITGPVTVGSSVYGATSAVVLGSGTFGGGSKASVSDNGIDAYFSAAAGSNAYLTANNLAALMWLDSTNNVHLSNSGSFLTGTSIYGATSATVNGALTIAGALAGATTGSFSGIVTASRFNGSGAGISAGSLPNNALVTTPVASVTASGNLASSGGTTPAITMTATPSFTSVIISTALGVSSGGTGSTTQNFVDLTTNQTIGGNKSFTGTVNLSGTSISAGTLNIGTGGVQTGVLPIANGGTAASSLLSSPFTVLTPASAQTGTINVTGNITGASHVAGSSIIAPTLWTLSNGLTAATFDFTTLTGAVTINQPLNVPGNFAAQGTPQYSFQRNKLINGGFVIDQRNNGAAITPVSGQLGPDRWNCQLTQAGKFTVQRDATSLGVPLGFQYCLGIVSQSAYAVTSTDTFHIVQPIEASNISDFGFGTASAKTVTLSFWAYSSLTGTFGGCLTNAYRSYPFAYSIPTANVWTRIVITIPGDTAGTWSLAGTGEGIDVRFGLGVGSNYTAPAGAWVNGNMVSCNGAVSLVSTSSATLYLANVQLETGSVATPFEQRQYGTELALCQRYCWSHAPATGPFGLAMAYSPTNVYMAIPFPVQMRANATFTYAGSPSDYTLDITAGSIVPSAINQSNGSNLVTQILITLAGATQGTVGSFRGVNSNAKFTFSAEL